MEDGPPSTLRNLGPAMDAWLCEIGVRTVGDLRAIGALDAWVRLRFVHGAKVSLVALYALDGALTGNDWRRLPDGRREALRKSADRILTGRT